MYFTMRRMSAINNIKALRYPLCSHIPKYTFIQILSFQELLLLKFLSVVK